MPRGMNYQDVHANRPLSNLSIAHFQSTDQFVSGRFFDTIPVSNASDTYTTYPQGYFNRKHNAKRTEHGVANSIDYRTIDSTYSCQDEALRIFVSDKKRANADGHRNLDFEATEAVTNALMINKESKFVEQFLASATAPWTTKHEGVASGPTGSQVLQWDVSGADPVSQVLAAHKEMLITAGGRRPNKGLMTIDVYFELRERADLIERIQYGSSNERPSMLSLNAIAQLFELEEILLMQSVVNNATDQVEDAVTGLPAVSNAFMASGTFLMAHVPKGAGLFSATAGLSFMWSKWMAGSGAGPLIRRYRAEAGVRGEWIEGEMAMDQKVVSPDLGVLFYDLLS